MADIIVSISQPGDVKIPRNDLNAAVVKLGLMSHYARLPEAKRLSADLEEFLSGIAPGGNGKQSGAGLANAILAASANLEQLSLIAPRESLEEATTVISKLMKPLARQSDAAGGPTRRV
jgi:hypothetical protein